MLYKYRHKLTRLTLFLVLSSIVFVDKADLTKGGFVILVRGHLRGGSWGRVSSIIRCHGRKLGWSRLVQARWGLVVRPLI